LICSSGLKRFSLKVRPKDGQLRPSPSSASAALSTTACGVDFVQPDPSRVANNIATTTSERLNIIAFPSPGPALLVMTSMRL
jgi:hypothetical protein